MMSLTIMPIVLLANCV